MGPFGGPVPSLPALQLHSCVAKYRQPDARLIIQEALESPRPRSLLELLPFGLAAAPIDRPMSDASGRLAD